MLTDYDVALEDVCRRFELISRISSRNEKQGILEITKNDPILEEVMKFLLKNALDWYIHFGCQSISDLTYEYVDRKWFSDFKTLLLRLTRERVQGEEIAMFLSGYAPMVRKWLRRVILKDLNMGVDWKTVNKVWPDLIKVFECQLAEACSYDNLETLKYPLWAEPKIDGVRAIAIIKPNEFSMISRGGNKLLYSPQIEKELMNAFPVNEYWVTDGELYAGDFNSTMKVVRRTVNDPDPELLAKLRYYVFDAMPLERWMVKRCKHPLSERRSWIPFSIMSPSNEHKVQKTQCYAVHDVHQAMEMANHYLQLGWEGCILKSPIGEYKFKRSPNWLKVKPVLDGVYEIVDCYLGNEGKHAGKLGGIIIKLPDGQTCRVGSGFSDEERESFWQNPPIGCLAQIEYKQLTPEGLLREPIYRCIEDA